MDYSYRTFVRSAVSTKPGQDHWHRNGHNGILFWTPPDLVESWKPIFAGGTASADFYLEEFIQKPHFAEDTLTEKDQRLLFRALLLAPFFPSRCTGRPIQVHLGLSHQRQHDTGKTTAGKLLGALLVGPRFEPTPAHSSHDRGEESLQLALMHQPFVLLDNVDTDIGWLNDFLCTYATGARPTKRKLYSDMTLVHIEYRGRLCVTSRKAKFNRHDTASRTIPFRFRPIMSDERKTEGELLGPTLANRGRIWAGVLGAIARVQDMLPGLTPPNPTSRLADFEELGWCIAAVDGQEAEWQKAIARLKIAQAGSALDDEPLVPVLRELLSRGDLDEQPTSQLFERCCFEAEVLAEPLPGSAAAFTKRLNELRELLEAVLEITITTRTLNGHTLIRITRASASPEVTQVTEVSPSSVDMGAGNE